ncbi:MAG: peptidoglycan DD-metalloendopeptidase family protein [Cyclobacteriaceae bacterium]
MEFYLIKVCIYQGAFALVYHLFLKSHTFHSVNRVYLLASQVFSFLLPLVIFSIDYPAPVTNQLSDWVPTVQRIEKVIWMEPIASVEKLEINFHYVLSAVYILGAALLLLRFAYNFTNIYKLKNKHELIESIDEARIFRILSSQPFSFFNQVYIPEKIWNTADYEKVITHEMHHVKQKHTYDRVLMDFITTLLWFNPFIYLFKKWLIEVHEFEADAAVVASHGDKLHYQITLLDMVNASQNSSLVSFFNFSITKRRIKMMNQTKSNRSSILRVLIIVPIITCMSVFFSFRPKENLSFEAVGTINDIYALLESKEIKSDTPSIFPVKTETAKKVRVSSQFGMRYDPYDKKKKHHRGIDIATEIGVPVIATADGTVELVKYQPNGYGNFVVIKHGDTYKTKYAHLDSYIVKSDEQVKKGEFIGYVGNSGKSKGSHLHYEVYKDDKVVNPVDYIKDYGFNK